MSPLMDDPEFRSLEKRVGEQAHLGAQIVLDLEKNSRDTEEIKLIVNKLSTDTQEIVKAFTSAKGAFEVLEWTGKVSKVLLPIVLVLGALTSALTSDLKVVKAWFGL